MKFIIGIGNPGKKYEKTRHNIGFRVLDELKKLGPKDTVLVRPGTFVNDTGRAVREIVERKKPDLKDLLVVCDDVNLAFGKMRLRASGGAGGHHGLLSVIESLGSEAFARLRLGVKNERMPKDLVPFVLEGFDAGEKKELPGIVKNAASVCESWAKDGWDAAMKRLSQLQSVKEKE
ncbi:MAG: peptidyl-tRNA hydrolase [Candidatus Omnitrophica bacterium]|nr:peptidyl-tRNA hydrolase [Candidatus Omnitrophota bacterium]